MIFLDTSYINSLIIKNDPYHKYSREIRSLLEHEAKAINSTVLLEVFNSISRYNFFGNTEDLRNHLLNLNVFDFLTEKDFEDSFQLFDHYDRSINFADCTIITTMQKLSITRIASFDSGFDRVKGFERIY